MSVSAATGKGSGAGNIVVAVRCRPLNESEKKSGTTLAVQCSPENNAVKLIALNGGKRPERRFAFDRVFGMYSRQEEVYETIAAPVVLESTQGYNCTLFAYGPTGTGKTHTMEGDVEQREQWGVIPRASDTILQTLQQRTADFTVKVSYLEIYNEELHDLLHTAGTEKRPLKLVEDLKRGVVCQNLEECTIQSTEQLLQLLRKGIDARVTAVTLKNQNSSRSHAIFSFRMIVKESNGEDEVVTTGQLNIVDLAGSESIARSGARNERAKEAGSINQSLLTLGRVITTLVDKAGHIPYRDSKLTRLLQESLGGKAKTCIIATLSPSITAVEESQSTLEYAMRARSVKNQPQQNSAVSQKVVMKEKFFEIESLRQQLLQTREKNGVFVDPQQFYTMEATITAQAAQLQECEEALRQRDDETKQLKHEKATLAMALEEAQKELSDSREHVDELTQELEIVKKEIRRTFLEYRASESLVGALHQSESSLFESGSALQQDLVSCQDDVLRLLQKVQRLKDSEAQKIADSQQFVEQMRQSTAELVLSLGAMQQTSSSHSQQVAAGIEQMRANGVDTCEKLTAAISTALEAMQQQAEASRAVMGGSCGELKQHLGDTQNDMQQQLQKLQVQTQQWLTAVKSELDEKAEKQLANQNKQIEVVSQVIASHCGKVRDLTDKFVSRQDALNADTLRNVDDVKEDILRRLDFYRSDSKEQIEKAREAISGKAQAMENAVKLMVQEMLKISNSALDAANTRAADMFKDTQQRFVRGSENVQQAQRVLQQSCSTFGVQLQQQLADTRGSFSAEMQQLEQQRIAVRGSVQHLRDACSAQQRALDGAVEDLLEDVAAGVRSACSSADATDATAQQMVADIRSASQRMNDAATTAAGGFTKFLGREGAQLAATLQQYASAVDSHLQQQSAGVEQVQQRGAVHGQSIARSELQPTATTPRAQRRTDSCNVQLQRTSSSDDERIKQQAREALLRDLEAQLLLFQGEHGSASMNSRHSYLLRRGGEVDADEISNNDNVATENDDNQKEVNGEDATNST